MSDIKIDGNVVVNETGMKLKDIAAGSAYATPVKLYESSSSDGTYSNFTLTDTIEHYDFFDIVYCTNDGFYTIRNVHRFERSIGSSNTVVTITYTWPNGSGSNYINYTKVLKLIFNGNNVTYGPCTEAASGGGSASVSTSIHIIAVYGYIKSSNTNYINVPTDSHIQSLISLLENYTPPEQCDVLYDNLSGTTGTVTLSKNIYNYDRIKIYGYNGTNQALITNEFKIKSITDQLQVTYNTNGNGIVYPCGTVYNVTSQQLTVAYHYRAGIYGSNIGYQGTNNSFYIIKVIGIKELTPSSFPTQPQIQTLINLLNSAPGSVYNYSTSEQIVGTWIDGKTLYRKVVTGVKEHGDTIKLINNGIGVTPTTFNIDNSKSYILNDISGTKYWLPVNFYGGSTDWIRTFGDPSYNIRIECGSAYSNYTLQCYIVIFYTKD